MGSEMCIRDSTPCISWAGGGGMTIGANHFGGGPMGGCAALSTELRVAHEKMCGGAETAVDTFDAAATELKPVSRHTERPDPHSPLVKILGKIFYDMGKHVGKHASKAIFSNMGKHGAATTELNDKADPTTEMTPCIQWAGHADTFDGPAMGGCAATSMLTVCIGGGNGHFGGGPMGGCAAAIALSAKTKGISTTCKHLSKIVKLPTTKLTPCISWAGSGGMTIGANHFGGGPMGGCAALSTELRSAHEKMCGGKS